MAVRAKWQKGVLGWLTNASVPVFALDHRRRVRFFNEGCIQLTEISPERILGRVCEHALPASEDRLDQLLSLWAPPPEVFAGQQLTRSLPPNTPTELGRFIQFLPLCQENGELEAVLGLVFPQPPERPDHPVAAEAGWHSVLIRLLLEDRKKPKEPFLAESPVRKKLWQQARLASEGMVPVYLQGPSGSGKQFLARSIHQHSKLSSRPFVPIECRVPANEELLQRLTRNIIAPKSSEEREIPGAVLLKHPEVLSAELLAQVLNSWQQKSDAKPLLMFSSEQNTSDLAAQAQLPPEIITQLETLVLQLPALTEIPAEIPLLAHQFVVEFNTGKEQQISGIEASLQTEMQEYRWPGNIRELKTFVQQALEKCTSRELQRTDMPVEYQMALDSHRMPAEQPIRPLAAVLQEAESQHLLAAVQRYGSNKTQLAQALGLSRPKLYRLLEEHGLTDR